MIFCNREILAAVITFIIWSNSSVAVLSNQPKVTKAETNLPAAALNDLKRNLRGQIYLKGSKEYESRRFIHNGLCDHIFPSAIAVPQSTQDVSEIVKVALKYEIELSVRSGGHSFICQSIKQDSLQIDLRELNNVELVSPHAARFGAGATFERILEHLPIENFTLIHGQSTTIGAGGFIQGLGVHPMGGTHRYGYGSDQVIEYTVVLADGSIAKISEHNTTIVKPGLLHEKNFRQPLVVEHGNYNDLHYAMRTSGGSFGIITEFLYKVYPKPETLSLMAFVFIENEKDFENLDRAAKDGRYSIGIFQPMVYRRPKLTNLMATPFIEAPAKVKILNQSLVEPVFVSVVDLNSPDMFTRAGPAIKFLKSFGLKLAVTNEDLIAKFGLDKINFAMPDQEFAYLTPAERKSEGYAGMVSANMNGLRNFSSFLETFLHHPVLGMYNRRAPEENNTGCDFCLWSIQFGVYDGIVTDTKIGRYGFELHCTYNSKDKLKSKNCPKMIRHAKQMVTTRALKQGDVPYQYVNTPSCDEAGQLFATRYWGNSYQRLLSIKQYWDPSNLFRFCQSVGSTKEDCCP